MVAMPERLLAKLEGGELLTRQEVLQVIAYEAGEIGLDLEDALTAARAGTLPRNPAGMDIALLAGLLDRSHQPV